MSERMVRSNTVVATGLLVVLLLSSAVAVSPAGTSASPTPAPPLAPAPSGAPLVAERSVQLAPGYAPPPGVTDLGPVAPNATTEVVVGLAPRDPAGLLAYADAVSVVGAPLYHRFLHGASALERYAAPSTATSSAERYFAAYGLSTTTNPDGLLLSVTGAAGALGRAFGTHFERYRAPDGRTFFDHPTPANLPAVAPWTGAFGLGDSVALVPAARTVGTTSSTPFAGCNAFAGAFNPCQIQQAYDFGPLLGAGTNGTGVRIGIVDPYDGGEPQTALQTDLADFVNANALSYGNVAFLYPVPSTVVLNSSSTNPGWGLEEAVDLEWARAAAPGASLVMTFSPNPSAGLYFAIDALVAAGRVDVLSLSWGEPDVGTYNPLSNPCTFACNATADGSYAVLGPVLELAAVEGISVFAASGDCGAAFGTTGVATSFPASEPWVTGVGGTNLSATSSGTYLSESAWSGNESGSSGNGCQNLGGSGGGFAPFPRPWWQVGPGTRGTHRGVPDVALDAAPWFELAYGGGFTKAYGTSVATPIWAGIAAIADQSAGADLGLLNPSLYALLNSSSYAAAFHDPRTGSNGYSAGVGWDPVTGIGTPIVASLVPLLTSTTTTPTSLRALLYAAPRFGPPPLTTTFVLVPHAGSGTYPLEGVAFGDGNSSLATNGTVNYTFGSDGVYSASAFVVDSNGTTAVSPPIVIVVGGGGPLSVVLTANTTSPAVGAPVTFNASVSGGTGPYHLNVSFGDGAFATNLTTFSLSHTFRAAGGYCVEAVARDAARPPDGGASSRLGVRVGGAAAPACGNPSSPLTVSAAPSPPVRDAPAQFASLFTVSGGVSPPAGLANNLSMASQDAYTGACACTIFRGPGNFSVSEWVNDTTNGQASATANVTVVAALNATFRASTLAGPVPLVVTFLASAQGGYGADANQTRWSFGDGTNATGASEVVTYATAGEYVVTASLSDRGHGNASEAFLIDVEPVGPPVVGVAGTISPAIDVLSAANVTFQGTLIGPAPSTAGAVLEWNLGNGHAAFGPSVTETYFAGTDALPNNTLAAGVSVLNPHLRTLFRLPITLRPFFAVETGGFVPAASALAFDAALAPTAGVVPLTVSGNASGTAPGGLGVSWVFGDQGSSGGLSANHTYFLPADYTVNATAYDPFHDQASRLNAVVVSQPLGVSGGTTSLLGDAPLTVNFSVAAYGGAGPPYSYLWSFPGGSQTNVTNLSLTFDQVGRYVVTVKVTDRANASVQLSWTVNVEPVPPVSSLMVLGAAVAVGAVAAVVAWRRRPRRPEPFIL